MTWGKEFEAMATKKARGSALQAEAAELLTEQGIDDLIQFLEEEAEVEAMLYRADVVNVLNAAFHTGRTQ